MSVDQLHHMPDLQDPSEQVSDSRANLIVILRATHELGAFIAGEGKEPEFDQRFGVEVEDPSAGTTRHIEVTRMRATPDVEAGYRIIDPEKGTLRVTGSYREGADITAQPAHLLHRAPEGVRSYYGWPRPLTGSSVPEMGEENRPALETGLWLAQLTPKSAQRIAESFSGPTAGRSSSRRR